MNWPEEVPILEAKDMHRLESDGPRGTHCLMGWCRVTFPNWMVCTKAEDALLLTIGRQAIPSIAAFNDDKKRPKTELAAVWNKAMAKLGYVVGNPEAKDGE